LGFYKLLEMQKQKIATKRQASKKVKTKSGSRSVPKNKRDAPSFYVITIGASAGGLDAVRELIRQIPKNINAAIFVVLHLSKAAVPEILVERIKKVSALPCSVAIHNQAIKPGHIYIAPPDAHLMIKRDSIIIGHGPAENRFRPSIDVMFRSAAASFGESAIGIVLTGFLNDGTAGMWAIKQSGGHCLVQDPNEAEYPDMPLSVVETMEADYCIPLKAMGNIIRKIAEKKPVKTIEPPAIVRAESRLSEKAATDLEAVSELGEKTVYACPDCGGGLWNMNNGRVKHYRCHIGHSYSEKDLQLRQSETIEQTLWVALRMMEERKILLMKLAAENRNKGLEFLHKSVSEQAGQLTTHIEKMKKLLFEVNKD
jgi:two-component system chemotaxis response regulator CheB